MRPGKEYEQFIYEKLKDFFPNYQVTLDEKILGKISGVERQIDVTIRGSIDSVEILYLVQCKDTTRKADVIRVGEFSAVIEDLGATRGILICSAGFAKTISRYAKNKKIDLFTIHDTNHPKWKIKVQIPVLFKKNKPVDMDLQIKFPTLSEDPSTEIEGHRRRKNFTRLSFDGGNTSVSLLEHINNILKDNSINLVERPFLNIKAPTNFDDNWVVALFYFRFNVQTSYYFFSSIPLNMHILKIILLMKSLLYIFQSVVIYSI